MVWAVLDVQTPARVGADIVERPYVTIGMAVFPVLLLPLGLTSKIWSSARMGPLAWRRLLQLIYPAGGGLGRCTYVWLAEGILGSGAHLACTWPSSWELLALRLGPG